MIDTLQNFFIEFWYYFEIQFHQIFIYWILGIFIGSLISVFAKDKIYRFFLMIEQKNLGVLGIFLASILGILSPLCMYGTIPIAASFSKQGMKDDMLGAFMMSSILLNPQLLVHTSALGIKVVLIRLNSCILVGFIAGLLLHIFYKNKTFFTFDKFYEVHNKDVDPHLLLRLLKNIGRNIKATGWYFLLGIVLSVLFQMYVPSAVVSNLFGNDNGYAVLLAATIGVPLYVCGGGTIPLLQDWLNRGMSLGAAPSFMITGPATKITNLGALKIVLGMKNFIIYLLFTMISSLVFGFFINMIF